VKGTRTAPECGFSHRLLTVLNGQGCSYEVVNVLDEARGGRSSGRGGAPGTDGRLFSSRVLLPRVSSLRVSSLHRVVPVPPAAASLHIAPPRRAHAWGAFPSLRGPPTWPAHSRVRPHVPSRRKNCRQVSRARVRLPAGCAAAGLGSGGPTNPRAPHPRAPSLPAPQRRGGPLAGGHTRPFPLVCSRVGSLALLSLFSPTSPSPDPSQLEPLTRSPSDPFPFSAPLSLHPRRTTPASAMPLRSIQPGPLFRRRAG